MRQDNPYAAFERVTPQAAPASPASSYAGFQPATPQPAAPRPQRPAQPRPQGMPQAAPQTVGDSGLTQDEIYSAQRAQGFTDDQIADNIEEMFGASMGAPVPAPVSDAFAPPLAAGGFDLPEGVVDWNNLSAEERTALGAGARVLMPQNEGETFRQIVTLRGSPYYSEGRDTDQMFGGIRAREENAFDKVGAFVSGAGEQIPLVDEAATLAGALAKGQSWSDARGDYLDMQTALNEQEGGLRDAGGIAGFAGAMALPAGGGFIGRGVDNADKIRRAALASGLIGSVYGATGSEGALEERAMSGLQAGALSAATGGILQGGLNRLSRPTAETAQRRLSRQGQELTLGQMLGGGAQRVEDAFTSLPFAGDVIRGRQRDTLSSFDTLATNTAISSLGEALASSAGRQGVRDADEVISGAYNRALDPITVNASDEGLMTALAEARSPERLTGDVAASLNSTLDNIFSQATGEIDGQTWKRIDSQLAAAARSADAGSATRPEMTALRDRLQQARAAWRDNLGRTNPGALEQVDAADLAEAQYRLVRRASSDVASAGRGGDASPATLNRAVVGAAGDRRVSRGESLMQDLTDDAMQVLPRTVPDSGTPFRSLITGAGLGGGGVALGVDPIALTLAGLLTGGVSAAYSKPAQQLANRLYRAADTGGTTRELDGLAEALRRAPVGVSLAMPDAQNSTQARRRVSQ